jgi:hypothetical protein
MEPGGLLQSLQVPTTRTYPEPELTFQCPFDFLTILFNINVSTTPLSPGRSL